MENSIKCISWGCPGSSVVKNLPANTGDTGLRRYHMLQSNSACGPQLLSLCSRAWEPQLLSPCTATTEAHMPQNLVFCSQRSHHHHHEKPTHRHQRVAPAYCNQRKVHAATKTQHSQKINKQTIITTTTRKNVFWFPDKLQAWVLENFSPVAIQQFSPATLTLYYLIEKAVRTLLLHFSFCCYIQTRFSYMEPIQFLVSMLIVNLHCN